MNRLRSRIDTVRRPLLGLACHNYNPAFLDMLGHLAVDVVWIEMEHSHISFAQAADLCRIAAGLGLLTMIRIPDSRRESVLKAAECGPDILDLPMANSVDVVTSFISHARFAPEGTRGFFAASRAVNYGFGPGIADIQQAINEELCLMAQIETKEAVVRAAEISSVPGLDAIFLGPGDLSASFGVSGQTSHPLVLQALEQAICAARKAGRVVALASGPADVEEWAAKGVDLLFVGSDISCLKQGLLETLISARGLSRPSVAPPQTPPLAAKPL
ncbi:MAG: aldolase [Armatimonadota bacterium]|nr:MAG: aldolase [Armatimonadota bacterium]